MPKISVIMGIYNGERTMREALDSIIAQTFTDWECIICDDASTDATPTILKEYQDRYPDKFILLRNEKNLMLSGSLNRCLAAASGEYIARMDDDDRCLPQRFAKEAAFLDEHPEYSVVGSNVQFFNETDGLGEVIHKIEEPTVYDVPKVNPFFHPTVMMRKSTYDALGGYTCNERTRRMEDVDLWYRFFAAGYQGYNIPEVLLHYRVDSSALKKRKLKYSVDASKIVFNGVKQLQLPFKYYLFALKPIASWLLPENLKTLYRKKK
ncbi:MAG: glycosyltransferase [Eubacterium sp.]|nr:glycosyltransferase [Eubacterium sp.]